MGRMNPDTIGINFTLRAIINAWFEKAKKGDAEAARIVLAATEQQVAMVTGAKRKPVTLRVGDTEKEIDNG